VNRKSLPPVTEQVEAFPHLQNELALLEQGYRFIAGLDEAGRGAWAGPVTAAAVILPLGAPDLAKTLSGLRDSKMLTATRREQFFDRVKNVALSIAVGSAPADLVDEINVIGATRYAMRQALANLDLQPDFLLVDHLELSQVNLPQHAFAKADSISLTVAAASVMAKVTRDRIMVELNQKYPAYAFDRHKGYGTQTHRAALARYGPCPLHRMSYEPLKVFIA
jgi:ribonuclease HII